MYTGGQFNAKTFNVSSWFILPCDEDEDEDEDKDKDKDKDKDNDKNKNKNKNKNKDKDKDKTQTHKTKTKRSRLKCYWHQPFLDFSTQSAHALLEMLSLSLTLTP